MSSSPTILVTTAAPGNASVMSEFLADNGFQAKTVTSLDAFATTIESSQPNLVLIDADGFPSAIWDCCEQLQEEGIPFFVISQHLDSATERSHQHDAMRVYEKPLGQDALLRTIQQLLEDE